MKKHAILVMVLSTMYFTNAQNFENNFKADICESFQEEFSKVRNSKIAFNNSFKKELTKYASIIDGAIQEDDVNKKFVKGQAARNELKLKFQVDLVYDCEFYYRAKLEERKKVMAKGIIGVSMTDLKNLNEMVAMYPKAMSYMMRAKTHFHLGNLKEAESDILESFNLDIDRLNSIEEKQQKALYAIILQEQGRYTEASKRYGEIYETYNDLDAAIYQAMVNRLNGSGPPIKTATLNNKTSQMNSLKDGSTDKASEAKDSDLRKLFKLKKNN